MHPGLLLKFGFTEKEAALYLSLLELGNGTASDLAKKAGLNRSTAYVILNPLIERGFVVASEYGGATTFTASPPEHLVAWLLDEARQRADLAQAAEALLPDLKALTCKPRIRYYEGSDVSELRNAASTRVTSVMPPGINVHDDKTTLFSRLENFAIVIESREIAENVRRLFAGMA